MKKIQIFLLLSMIILTGSSIAQNGFTQADRDLLIRNSEETKALRNEMVLRFEAVDKRMELDEKNSDKRFDQIDKRFVEQHSTNTWIISLFTFLTATIITLAFWDRRSSLRPLEERTKFIELEIEKLNGEPRFGNVIEAFRNLAKDNPKVAEILKNFHLL